MWRKLSQMAVKILEDFLPEGLESSPLSRWAPTPISNFTSPRSIPILAVFVFNCMTKMGVVAGGKLGRMFFWPGAAVA